MSGPQATVREWDPARGGSAFLDDGTVVVLPPECLQGSRFRFLRLGQRVRLVLDEGVVVRVDLPT
ncbi:MAG: hypothetical protein WCD35_02840 [Mycobacteriales bacterium]